MNAALATEAADIEMANSKWNDPNWEDEIDDETPLEFETFRISRATFQI